MLLRRPSRRPALRAPHAIAPSVALLLAASAAGAQQAPAAAPAPDRAADERAVAEVVTRLFDAMRARDTAAMRAAFVPGAVLATTGVRDGRPTVSYDSLGAFLRSVGGAPAGLVLDERLYGTEVRVSDGLASVWTEYDFYAGPRFSHCGVDALHLARTADGWRIVALADTRRREGCPTR